jgi:WD40 repeat protein
MPSYRYPGPRPFEENDINLFFGRDKDKKNLLTFINVEQMLVLFSKSGLGKSSLINAAVIPELRKKNYEIILCRFNSYVNKEPGENIDAQLLTPLQKLFNEITVNQLKQTPEPTFLDKLKSNESFSLWHQFKNLQVYNKEKKTYFIFFDQFEELFTYPKEQVREFKEHLAELLSASVPQEYLDKINQLENDTAVSDLTNDELSLLYETIPVKILCTIRSDKFSLLTNLKDAIPGIITKTYELKPFSEIEATEAIRKPASIEDNEAEDNFISDAFTYDDDAVNKMLSYLSDDGTEDIESFQLQVLCRYVEDMVIENKKNGTAIKTITVNQLGDIKNIFEAYYNKLIEGIDKDKIQNVKKLFEDGLIFEKDKIRVSLYEGQIESSYGVDETLLNKLVGTHLIRCEPDTNGKEKYELSHDSLIEPILKAKEIRLEEEKAKLQKTKFRKRVELFGAIAIGLFIIFAVILYMFTKSAKRDKLEINFLVAEKDWFYLLDSSQRRNAMNNDFLFLVNKDSVKYNALKYSYKCAAYTNLYSATDYSLALKFAQEGFLKDSNNVIKKSFDDLIHKPDIYLPSLKIRLHAAINNIKVTDDQKQVIAATSGGIFWFDANNGKATDSLTLPEYKSDYSVFSAKGDYVLYESYYSDTTHLLNFLTKQNITTAQHYNSQPHSIAFDIALNNEFYVHATGNNIVTVNMMDGAVLRTFSFPISDYDNINEVSISPDNNYFAVGTSYGEVFLVDLRNSASKNKPLLLLDTSNKTNLHSGIVNSVSFSSDSKYVLTGSADDKVQIWNVHDNNIYQTLTNFFEVFKCRFSNNNNRIIIGANSAGIITSWAEQKQNSNNIDQGTNKRSGQFDTSKFYKEPLQLLGLDSTITSANFYNNDSKIIASSNHEIALWNLNPDKKISLTVNSIINAGIIPHFSMAEKLKSNLITLQDLLTQTQSKKEVLDGIKIINDSLRNLYAATDTIEDKQTFINLTDLSLKLYDHLQQCKNNDLNKRDSFNLFIYLGKDYYYKIQLDKAINGKFGRNNLDELIHFRQALFSLDTLQSDCFNYLFDAYAIPIAYYFKVKQYDSLLYWNNKLLADNPQVTHIEQIRDDVMSWYQYDVSFRILKNDIAGAKKAIEQWPERDNISYILSDELFEICSNRNYFYDENKLKQVFEMFDLKDEYNKQNVTDMDAVLLRLLDEKETRKFNQNTIENLADFDNYIYSAINK